MSVTLHFKITDDKSPFYEHDSNNGEKYVTLFLGTMKVITTNQTTEEVTQKASKKQKTDTTRKKKKEEVPSVSTHAPSAKIDE